MRIYYAHPISLYGTPQEARDIATLGILGFEVVSPSLKEKQELAATMTSEERVNFFVELARGCDILAFRGFPDGSIGAGIAKEIAAMGTKPVFELPSNIMRRILTIEETRLYLAESGQR